MKKISNYWKGYCVLAFSFLLTGEVRAAASSCDLAIKNVAQVDSELSFNIYSSKAEINPFKVTLSQNGNVAASWSSIPHVATQPLKIGQVKAVGIATVRIESVKYPTCYVEKEITINPDISKPLVAGQCDLSIVNFTQSKSNLLFDLYSSRANINPFNVKIIQGTKELGSWNNVPHSMGALLKVDGVSSVGDATVTITSAKDASCTAQRVIKLESVTADQKGACKQGPALGNLSNITSTGMIAQFHGQDVFGIDYFILNSKGETLFTGSVEPKNASPSITYTTLAAGNYKLVFRGNTCSGESSKEFTVNSDTIIPPIPSGTSGSAGGGSNGQLPVYCEAGPDIKSISNISSSGLSALFHGVDINGIEYKILNSSGSQVAGGNFTPKNNTPSISFPVLGSGDYTLVFSGANCLGQSSMSFQIKDAVVPNPDNGSSSGSAGGGASCAAGPEIQDINSVTDSSLVFQFHGVSISGIAYTISNDKGSAASGTISPKNSSPSISFSKLAAGNYTLNIKATNCEGASSRAFVVTDTSVIANPPVDPAKPPVVIDPVVTGNIIPRTIGRGLPDHMNIQISGSSENWILNDASTLTPPGGYDFQYQINGQIIRQGGPLRNFAWPSNNELGIFKIQIKQGIDTFNKWECPTNGYYVCDAGATFSHNISAAFANFAFVDSGPGNYNPETKKVQWMDLVGDFTDTSHGVWVLSVGKISSPESLLRKGGTHFSRREMTSRGDKETHMNAGRLYNDVEILPAQLNLSDRGGSNWVPAGKYWPEVWNTRFFEATSGEPLTSEQGKQKGEQYSTESTVMVFENTEQDHAVGSHWPFWREYYKALSSRMQERWGSKGIPYYVAHNYFTTFSGNGMTLGDGGKDANKSILKTPVSQWPANALLPGGTLEYTNATCFGVYLSAPDINMDTAYKLMFSAEVNKKANKKLLVFMQPMHEWKPNNFEEVIYPDGKFYHYVKLPHNPSQAKAYGFLSRAFASGMIFFGSNPKSEETFRLFSEFHDGKWLLNGSTDLQDAKKVNFPYWAPPSSYEVFPSNGADDMVAFGIDLYNKTFAATRGGDRKFLKFRLNGGDWTAAANNEMDDLVEAYYNKKGLVFSQMKDGKLAVFYLNPYADNSKNTLEFEHNGKVYSMTVQSSNVHAKLINL